MYNFLKPYLLTHPPIPKAMHGLTPRSIMGRDWWDEKRFAAQKQNNYHCWGCGVHKSEAKFHQWLEGHESYNIDFRTGKMELEEIVSLCHSCHNYIHSGLLKIKLEKGEIDIFMYNAIIEHGNEIVKNLIPWKKPDCPEPAWEDWHIIIDGKAHYSLYENEAAWARRYGRR